MAMKRRSLGPSHTPVPLIQRAETLRHLELRINRRLDGLVAGEFRGVNNGPGIEPSGARRYEPGDDARRLDWSLTARSLEPHVRMTEAERELETWIVADRSASLDFGTAKCEKRDIVLAAACTFGSLSVRRGNRLGVLTTGGPTITRSAPRSSRTSLMASLAALHDTPRHDSSTPVAPSANLADGLEQLARIHRRRGQVIVVSDFLDGGDWGRSLRGLATRHQVICVQVVDPRELSLPAVGMLSVVDTETGRLIDVQTNSARLRDRYQTAAKERHGHIAGQIRAAGAEHLVLSTDGDWLADITTFIGRRRRVAALPLRVQP